jgi:hypothetical protein
MVPASPDIMASVIPLDITWSPSDMELFHTPVVGDGCTSYRPSISVAVAIPSTRKDE